MSKETVKTLLEMDKKLNQRAKIESAKRGLNLTDTINAVLDESLLKLG